MVGDAPSVKFFGKPISSYHRVRKEKEPMSTSPRRESKSPKAAVKGLRTVIYPVKDIARAKALFRPLLGVEPYADQPYYVGFRVGDQEFGLDPTGHRAGMMAYFDVDDINRSLSALLEAGADVQQEIRDVGGGRLIAIVRDPDGDIIGLLQSS